jgi:hypothetical protein
MPRQTEARGVFKGRQGPGGGVEVSFGVLKERLETNGGVVVARGVVLKRVCPKTGVALRPGNHSSLLSSRRKHPFLLKCKQRLSLPQVFFARRHPGSMVYGHITHPAIALHPKC